MKTVGQRNRNRIQGSGGALVIKMPTGEHAVVATSTPYSGWVAVNDVDGKLIASVPDASEETDEGEGS